MKAAGTLPPPFVPSPNQEDEKEEEEEKAQRREQRQHERRPRDAIVHRRSLEAGEEPAFVVIHFEHNSAAA